ncbi:Alpha-(1,3)-fucosyltransferase C [Toxocara canis]|uniref:Fucosyltransferase n=1 Tax=Toxocara canis TaxID=6265 RepID=A0A0B2W2X8_TOXCA|nr:Alpha-(1,3)-fucosyltransferase C [Toxocara canis]
MLMGSMLNMTPKSDCVTAAPKMGKSELRQMLSALIESTACCKCCLSDIFRYIPKSDFGKRKACATSISPQIQSEMKGHMSGRAILIVLLLAWCALFFCYERLSLSQLSSTVIAFKLLLVQSFVGEDEPFNQTKLILAWTSFFGEDMAKWLSDKGLSDCEYSCTATSNRSNLSEAAAVIFHIRNLNPKDLPPSRSEDQLFAFFLQESPHHTGNVLEHIPKDYFNVTMTYRKDSDVHAGYGWLRPIDNSTSSADVWKWEEIERIIERKNRSVLQMVSNCATASKRELYVRALAQHIELSELGGCANRTCNDRCGENAIAQHYFYLAFENSVCRDYVTEKAFHRMEKIILPIVLKRSIASAFLPNGSFIAADDFDSPEELAHYLKYLQNNKTEYFRYFEWTKLYKKRIGENFACNLCRFLHTNTNVKKTRVVSDIKRWWFGGGECIADFAKKLLLNE